MCWPGPCLFGRTSSRAERLLVQNVFSCRMSSRADYGAPRGLKEWSLGSHCHNGPVVKVGALILADLISGLPFNSSPCWDHGKTMRAENLAHTFFGGPKNVVHMFCLEYPPKWNNISLPAGPARQTKIPKYADVHNKRVCHAFAFA